MRSVRSGILHKKGVFRWQNFKKNLIFLNKFAIFDQKFQNMETSGNKFVIFDQKLKKHRDLGDRAYNFKGFSGEEWVGLKREGNLHFFIMHLKIGVQYFVL